MPAVRTGPASRPARQPLLQLWQACVYLRGQNYEQAPPRRVQQIGELALAWAGQGGQAQSCSDDTQPSLCLALSLVLPTMRPLPPFPSACPAHGSFTVAASLGAIRKVVENAHRRQELFSPRAPKRCSWRSHGVTSVTVHGLVASMRQTGNADRGTIGDGCEFTQARCMHALSLSLCDDECCSRMGGEAHMDANGRGGVQCDQSPSRGNAEASRFGKLVVVASASRCHAKAIKFNQTLVVYRSVTYAVAGWVVSEKGCDNIGSSCAQRGASPSGRLPHRRLLRDLFLPASTLRLGSRCFAIWLCVAAHGAGSRRQWCRLSMKEYSGGTEARRISELALSALWSCIGSFNTAQLVGADLVQWPSER
ncbi:hypothetical protein BD309DRAFT_922662 [Dichomitus squalens]|uniref:Uncharacterized protein n=2 Tax=Dichomitus squalens TaxID=114155 RepID=A0A4Q9PJ78_9APHY|nr:uncharacterized protein DICSQDRAFT_128797 [Dichomitus squalens LYAD-421 SS1]EJF58658.1 hypothetical protein DICSQDRAFT_128797 [Dichomitus squalens LYAD-421 SS1]TBU24476.1 hypothetical protein BD311DRAFT_671758 [Dichomitus squalens]TBU42898.1 hypothetical protein BD309DRAFT_922662 [Dichomitus squalens]TBU54126.1 hypothetical protein BD310DRAFT_828646 [Dichomitus squalens]